MVCHVLSNPQHFVIYAKKQNVTYEYLLEAFECIGQQATARMFSGSSSRGEINSKSAATLMNWMKTFEFIKDNPEHVDDDQHQAKSIVKNGDEWDKFVELIKQPISQDEITYWESLSLTKLSEAAHKHGITIGTKNSKAQKNLLTKMKEMYHRRNQNIWSNSNSVIEGHNNIEQINYRCMNIFQLKEELKRKEVSTFNKTKTEMIKILESNNETIISKPYTKMTLMELKDLCTQREFLETNKLNRNSLIKWNAEFDKNITNEKNNSNYDYDDIKIKKCSLEIHNDSFDFIIDNHGMINVTQLCKTKRKNFRDYYRTQNSKIFIAEYMRKYSITDESEIIQIRQGGTPELQGTWVVSKIAIDVARWVHPSFAVQIAEWIDKLIFEGFVTIDKPIFERLSDESYDNEAITLEKDANILEHTNCIALYIAYIGKGLVKIGSSDSRLCLREEKHTGCESEYDQFRILKVFEISSRTIEHTVHKFLDKYRYPFNKQREIFRPNSRLKDFIDMVDKILQDNDLKLVLEKQMKINHQLQIELLEAKNTILTLQLQIQK